MVAPLFYPLSHQTDKKVVIGITSHFQLRNCYFPVFCVISLFYEEYGHEYIIQDSIIIFTFPNKYVQHRF